MAGGALRMTEGEYAALVASRAPVPAVEVPADTPWTPEHEWRERVVGLAQAAGWRVAQAGDARGGFPCLVLVRERVVLAEVKSAHGRLTGTQAGWRDALRAAGAEWHLWRPADIEVVLAVLAPGGAG